MTAFRRTAFSMVLLLAAARMTLSVNAASITIPAGAALTVRMTDQMDSQTNHAGETFRATVDSPVTVNGTVAIPQGAEAIGRIASVSQAGRFRGRPVLMLELTALNFGGKSIPILTSSHQEMGHSQAKQTGTVAGTGGMVGTVIGAVAGGPPGLLIGAAIGAAGGAVVQVVRGPQPLRIPAESLILFTVQSPVSFEPAY